MNFSHMPPQRDEHAAIQDFLQWRQQARQEEITEEPAKEGRYFISQTALQSYLSRKHIDRLLDALFPDQDVLERPPSRQIIDRYLRVFSILLCIGHGRFIKHFVQFESLQDTKLPFGSCPSCFPRSADGDLFEVFQQRQWEFCCPTFNYDMQSHYEPERILPIIRRERIKSGGSAIIYKIRIVGDYNDLDGPKWKERGDANDRNTYVLKSYRTRDAEKYFKAERKAFMMLRHASEPAPNTVAYFGSYHQNERYNAILEYMNTGSLEEYMEAEPPPHRTSDLIAFWEGLFGIARALTQIHGLRLESTVDESPMVVGWHQDIKPSNILVGSDAESSKYKADFKLADLGLSHFKEATSPHMTAKDSFGTRAYGAPEAFRPDKSLSRAHFEIKRQVDVWSLGCVLSEAATWVTGGFMAVTEYRLRRHDELQEIMGHDAGHIFHDGSKVLCTVLLTHRKIRSTVRKNDDITCVILDIIEHDVLVGEDKRVGAKFLLQKLIRCIQMAKKRLEENYHADTIFADGTHAPVVAPSSSTSTASTAIADELDLTFRPKRLPVDMNQISSSSLTEAPIQLWRSHQSPNGAKSSSSNDVNVTGNHQVPSISVSDGLLMKERHKRGLASIPHRQLLESLRHRDHVFLIDNSKSMEPYRDQIGRVLELLVYMTKEYDPDGIDILFTSDQGRKSLRSSKAAKNLMGRATFSGFTDMSHCLGKILQEYQIDWARRQRRFIFKQRSSRKQLSIYVLTDGVWQPHNDVTKVIKAFITDLGDLHLQLNQVGIQFIQFGKHPLADERLRSLDSQEPFKDILDLTPSNGNVMKMLLGSINHWYDDDHWQDEKSY